MRIIFVKIVDHVNKFWNKLLKKLVIILLKSLLLFLFTFFSNLIKVFQDSFDYE